MEIMKRNVQCQIVTTTVAKRQDARRLAHLAVDAKLAACVQITPIHSVYRWRGKVESADELLLTAKTRASRVPGLIRLIRANHPYELPEILVHKVDGGLPAYLAWVAAETR